MFKTFQPLVFVFFATLVGGAYGLQQVRPHTNNSTDGVEHLGLKDVAIGLLSGRPEMWDSVYKAMLQYTARGLILESPGWCECNFVAGFKALQSSQPDAEWYYVGDDDAFIYLDRLGELLAKHESSTPTFIATLDHNPVYKKICGKPSPIPGTGNQRNWATFYGGTGFIANKAMMKEVDWSRECHHNTHNGDRDASCLIGESWQDNFIFVEMNAEKNGNREGDSQFSQGAEGPTVVVHHLEGKDIENMGKDHHSHLHAKRDELEKVPLANNYGYCYDDDWKKKTHKSSLVRYNPTVTRSIIAKDRQAER